MLQIIFFAGTSSEVIECTLTLERSKSKSYAVCWNYVSLSWYMFTLQSTENMVIVGNYYSDKNINLIMMTIIVESTSDLSSRRWSDHYDLKYCTITAVVVQSHWEAVGSHSCFVTIATVFWLVKSAAVKTGIKTSCSCQIVITAVALMVFRSRWNMHLWLTSVTSVRRIFCGARVYCVTWERYMAHPPTHPTCRMLMYVATVTNRFLA